MGVYQLVMFVSSPLFGWALSHQRIQPRSLLWIGLLMDGFFSAAFGFVVFLRQSFIFFGTSLVLRTMQSLGESLTEELVVARWGPVYNIMQVIINEDVLGNSASMTCYFTLLGADFPSLLGQLIPVIEAAFSAGLIAGPFFGGLLFHYLGFCATFLIFGGSLALLGRLLIRRFLLNYFYTRNADFFL